MESYHFPRSWRGTEHKNMVYYDGFQGKKMMKNNINNNNNINNIIKNIINNIINKKNSIWAILGRIMRFMTKFKTLFLYFSDFNFFVFLEE